MEITIETMGRLIKNLVMALRHRFSVCFGYCRGLALRYVVWLRTHLHAIPHLLDTFSNHLVAGLEALANDPLRADLLAGLHLFDGDLAIAADQGNHAASLQFGYGPLRHGERTLFDPGDGAYIAVAAWAENVSRIWKCNLNVDRPGSFIDLAVHVLQPASPRVGGTVGENKFEAEVTQRRFGRH